MITQTMIDRLEQKRRKAQTQLSNELSVHITPNGDAIFFDTTGYSPIRKFVLTREELQKLLQVLQKQTNQVNELIGA